MDIYYLLLTIKEFFDLMYFQLDNYNDTKKFDEELGITSDEELGHYVE